MDDLAVNARGVSRRFGGVQALDAVSLAVPAGQVRGLLGPNGAGKSTLLKVLLGLAVPDAGSVHLWGRDLLALGQPALAGVAGFVDAPAFWPTLSARDCLRMLADLDGTPRRLRNSLVDAALTRAGLDPATAGRKVRGWSTGMRQRLALAAALVRRPRLLVLDEPFTGLDPAGAADLRRLITDLAAEGTTVLVSSHDMAQVEQLCPTITVLHRGRVAFDDTATALAALAPAPQRLLVTSDDAAALQLPRAGGAARLTVTADGAGQGLRLEGGQADVDAFVLALGRAGIAVRGLERGRSPLEAAFLRLTADAEEQPPGDPVEEVAA